MDKRQRLRLFIDRVAIAPGCSSYLAARQLVEDTLNAVEDEHSGVTSNPPMWRADGRLYPPQDDQAFAVKGFPHITRFRSRRHTTWIGENGAIRITERNGKCILEKPGADGTTISEMLHRKPLAS